jgi:magnesium transport protein corA
MPELWRDITIDTIEQRRALLSELRLPELQARMVREHRWLPQAIEGEAWLLLTLDIPYVSRHNVKYHTITILLSKTEIITLHQGKLDDELIQRITALRPSHTTPSLILATIAQFSIEQFMPLLNHIDDVTDQLEDTMIRTPDNRQLQQLFVYKRQLADLRKVVLPLMNVLNGLSNGRYALFDKKCAVYVRDSYDYAWRVHELIDTMRDLLTSALDMYLSVVSNRMNDVMKRLTLVATVFMPVSFLTGLGGMNFVQLPFRSDVAFWLMIGLIVLIPLAMVGYFVRHKWL